LLAWWWLARGWLLWRVLLWWILLWWILPGWWLLLLVLGWRVRSRRVGSGRGLLLRSQHLDEGEHGDDASH